MPRDPAVTNAIEALVPPLLGTLERVVWVQRYLFPPRAGRLADELTAGAEGVGAALRALEAAAWPAEFHFMRDRLIQVTQDTLDLIRAFATAARSPEDFIGLYRPLRRFAAVQEALYPLAPVLEPVNRWFLEPARRNDDVLTARLRAAAFRDDDVRVGVLHAANDRDTRGGFSLYVPEPWDGRTPMPLVVALHGGHGHGRDFLWSWLREARGRGVLLTAPTSRDRTWSMIGEDDVDAGALRTLVETVAGRYPVNRARVLLTGMSDGATYTLLCGLRDGMPFTHLAPMCGVLHPLLVAGHGIALARDRPIYLVHGALDWMFPVDTARMAREVLVAAGARLVYRELEDLSHAYPRDENPRVLDWLLSD
jgi:phospholipase/carboxylesterase